VASTSRNQQKTDGVQPVVATKRRLFSSWRKTETEDESSDQGEPAKKVRRTPTPWTPEEELALAKGVRECGVGEWAAIRRKYFNASTRTGPDMKDKWRLMSADKAHLKLLYRKC
jgi:hypothetical protein